MATPEQIETLLQRMREMSAADISVLEACLNTPESSMTTAPGSHNDMLWTEMVAYGWMIRREEELELPGGSKLLMKIYTISPEGRQPIISLLSALTKQ